jgi:hypothetical protein
MNPEGDLGVGVEVLKLYRIYRILGMRKRVRLQHGLSETYQRIHTG